MLRRNAVANFVGRAWSGGVTLALLPVYGRLLGVEALALIGVYALLVQIVGLLDMGMSPTLAREAARLTSTSEEAAADEPGSLEHTVSGRSLELRDLVRSIEAVYWPVGLMIALCVAAFAPLIAYHWIPASHAIQPSTVQRAVVLMGISLSLQWPYTLYEGVLLGLRRQVALNAVNLVCVSIRGFGALGALHYRCTVDTFFTWQATAYCLQTLAVGLCAWRCLPRSGFAARFRFSSLRSIWHYASGMAAITSLGFVLTQMDKFALSHQLPMAAYAMYVLAFSAAGGLYYIVAPLYAAYFPHFVQLASSNGSAGLIKLYHNGCQVVSALILPAAAVMAISALSVMLVWTNSTAIALHAAPLLRLLAIAFALFCLMHMPMAVLLASGETRTMLRHNLVSVIVGLPAMLWAVRALGAPGAACVWMGINAGYLAVLAPVMHRRIMPGEYMAWLVNDLLVPTGVATAAAFGLHLCVPLDGASRLVTGGCLIGMWAITSVLTIAVLPMVRTAFRLPRNLFAPSGVA